MFKKKPNIKALAPLRSSDRRRIAEQIIDNFQLEIPDLKGVEHEGDAPADSTPGIGALRNSLLPDGSLSAKFTTTAGPDLKQVSGSVYVGSYAGEEQRVLWIKVDERIIPTVYTLWNHPHLLPLLHTPDVVLQKLRGGADLMIPGLARGPPFPHNATENAIVAIASVEHPNVPIVVGKCEIDISALTKVRGVKGHAVHGLHWSGDEIWAWSHNGKPGGLAPKSLIGGDNEIVADKLERKIDELDLKDHDEGKERGVAINTQEETPSGQNRNNHIDGEDPPPFEEAAIEEPDRSTREIDEVFRKAFLYAIYHHCSNFKGDPHYGLAFPLPQSLVISNLVIPYLPIYTSKDALSLQIKKTSWKNAKKFIKALDKEKILTSKDRNGGETVVQGVNFDDPLIKNFMPYKLPKKKTPGAESGGRGGGKASAAGISNDDDSVGQRLKKITLVRPKDKLSPIFEAVSASVKSLYLPTELRSIMTSYIESENLVSPTNKRWVRINPILANAVFDGQSSVDREVLEKGSVPRDALIDRIVQSCSPYWAILRNEETREDGKARAGHAPAVRIVLETRSGNKTVTKVSGLEAFYINPHLLGEELQKACASATNVSQLIGSSPKNPVQEIMVQGPQKDIITKALEKRGMHRQWIELLDKTKGKQR